jgi:tetratricopeptide (TPR) repeat protein
VAARTLLARRLLARGQREQAALQLEAALRADPTRADAKLDLARLYAQDGRLAQASELARQLRRDAPASPSAAALMGTVLLAQGRPGDAVDAFATAIQLGPDLIEAHRGLGRAQQAMGQTDRAVASYERALALDGNDVGALTSLASILGAVPASSDRALTLASRAAKLRPAAPDVLDTLGWVHYRRGAYAEAERALARAVERAPDSGLLRYHLGMAYVRLERPLEAVIALREAARLDAGLARSERLDELIIGLGGQRVSAARVCEQRHPQRRGQLRGGGEGRGDAVRVDRDRDAHEQAVASPRQQDLAHERQPEARFARVRPAPDLVPVRDHDPAVPPGDHDRVGASACRGQRRTLHPRHVLLRVDPVDGRPSLGIVLSGEQRDRDPRHAGTVPIGPAHCGHLARVDRQRLVGNPIGVCPSGQDRR